MVPPPLLVSLHPKHILSYSILQYPDVHLNMHHNQNIAQNGLLYTHRIKDDRMENYGGYIVFISE